MRLYAFSSLTRIAVLSWMMILPACTLAPHYERPAAPMPATYPQGTATSGVSSNTASEIGWRQFFGDPCLQRAIEIALANNRDLRIAGLNVEQIGARYRIQRAKVLPTLDARSSITRGRMPGSMTLDNRSVLSTQYSVGLSAAWEIDFFGKLRSLKDKALAQYLSTAQARKAAEISLIAQVAQQYLTTRAYDAQLAIARASLKTARRLHQLAQAKVKAGMGSSLDLQATTGAFEQARANYREQLRLRDQAINALGLLLGQEIPAELPKPLPLESQKIIADIQAGLPSDLLTRRPDILAAEEELHAANADIGAARAAFFPSISLTGQLGSASRDLDELFKSGSSLWSFVPQISLPIFNGGANMAGLDQAHIQKNIAIARYEKAIQVAFREVADGLTARVAYDEQLTSLERYVRATKHRLELSTLRYRQGIDSYLGVLNAQTEHYAAQQRLNMTRLARLTNLVDLYRYLGGGWLEHTGDVARAADAPA
jgi:multidrug efflux system outer membrane protein